jgi:hypothetical protein
MRGLNNRLQVYKPKEDRWYVYSTEDELKALCAFLNPKVLLSGIGESAHFLEFDERCRVGANRNSRSGYRAAMPSSSAVCSRAPLRSTAWIADIALYSFLFCFVVVLGVFMQQILKKIYI